MAPPVHRHRPSGRSKDTSPRARRAPMNSATLSEMAPCWSGNSCRAASAISPRVARPSRRRQIDEPNSSSRIRLGCQAQCTHSLRLRTLWMPGCMRSTTTRPLRSLHGAFRMILRSEVTDSTRRRVPEVQWYPRNGRPGTRGWPCRLAERGPTSRCSSTHTRLQPTPHGSRPVFAAIHRLV